VVIDALFDIPETWALWTFSLRSPKHILFSCWQNRNFCWWYQNVSLKWNYSKGGSHLLQIFVQIYPVWREKKSLLGLEADLIKLGNWPSAKLYLHLGVWLFCKDNEAWCQTARWGGWETGCQIWWLAELKENIWLGWKRTLQLSVRIQDWVFLSSYWS